MPETTELKNIAWSLISTDGKTLMAYQEKEVETVVFQPGFDVESCITHCEELILKIAGNLKMEADKSLAFIGNLMFVYRTLLMQPRKPKSKLILPGQY